MSNPMDAFHSIEEVALMLGQGAKVECQCAPGQLIVRAGVVRLLDQLCAGQIEAQCRLCGKVWLYNLGDTFTLGTYRQEVKPK